MKDDINLLPKPLQRARLWRLYNQRLLRVSTFLLAGVALVVVVQIGCMLMLQRLQTAVQASASSSNQEFVKLQETVRRKNQLIDEVAGRMVGHDLWTVQAEDILKAVPDGLFVTELTVAANRPALIVRARSTSRLAGVTFQKNIEARPWVGQVEAPLQNFALGPTTEFAFTIFRKEKTP